MASGPSGGHLARSAMLGWRPQRAEPRHDSRLARQGVVSPTANDLQQTLFRTAGQCRRRLGEVPYVVSRDSSFQALRLPLAR
jgi:hypothetical protein